ncbi:hypothetical protein ATCC90586_009663 [Pythium insidiosum]|nr:hypothetical protein ATCC90586_009663 [Pythium insidiosum]
MRRSRVAASIGHAAGAELERIRVSGRCFALLWLFMLLARALMFVYLSALALAYWAFATPIADNTRDAYRLPRPPQLRLTGLLLGACGLLFGWNVAQMAVASLAARRLRFSFPPPPARSESRRLSSLSLSASPWGWRRLARLLLCPVASLYHSLFSPHGLFGIHHPRFLQMLFLRELVEVASQALQAYYMSHLIPRPRLKHLSVALLVLNCWSTLLVHWLVPRRRSLQRVLCLTVDAAFDFVWAVALPCWLLLFYALELDPALGAFPMRRLANKEWMLSWQMEAQHLCVTSWADLLSTLMPCLSLFAAMRGICGMFEARADADADAAGPSLRHKPQVAPALPAAEKRDPEPLERAAAGHGDGHGQPSAAAQRVGHAVFFAAGLAVLGVHAWASLRSAMSDELRASCVVVMKPWFSSRQTCAYANINCARLRSRGPWRDARDASEVVAMQLARVDDPAALLSLVISHCENLTLPPGVRRLVGLTSLDIYNASLAAWPAQSALDRDAHPDLRTLGLLRVRTGGAFPRGLLSPLDVADVRLIATDLEDLPLELDALWPNLKYVSLEHGRVRAVPRLLASLPRLLRLGLTNNRLASVPASLPGDYRLLSLNRNPLQALPASLPRTETLSAVQFDHTNVSAVPQWLRDLLRAGSRSRPRVRVFGYATPLCAATDAASARERDGVQCHGPGLRDGGVFPFQEYEEIMALERPATEREVNSTWH